MQWFNRRSVRVVSPPSNDKRAVTVEEMKSYLRVECSDDDVLIGDFIDTATVAVRNFTGRALLKETLELTIDSPDCGDESLLRLGSGVHTVSKGYAMGFPNDIDLPFPPLIEIESIKTYDTDDTEATFPEANYLVDTTSGRVTLNQGSNWPANLRDRQAMKIVYDAGYAQADLPSPIKMAIRMAAAYMYECREACELPPNCLALLEPYKLYDLMGW